MAFTSITIQNFRGIKSLEISDFGQVNVFVGKNNSGKTSVLEAVWAAIMPDALSSSSLVLRGEQREQESYLFFRNANIDETPTILANYANSIKRKLELQITDFENLDEDEKYFIRRRYSSRRIDDIASSPVLQCIIQDFRLSQENLFSQEPFEKIIINIADEGRLTGQGRLNGSNGKVLTARRYDAGISKKLHPLIVEKSIQSIVSVLSQVDDKIAGIQLGLNDSVLFDIGLPRLVPLHVMGDGMRQTLSILATIASSKNEIVFIDEIDNGLHYSTLSILWEAILKAAKEFNVQVFATTHSYECLAALAEVQEANLLGEDIVRVFRLERDGEEHRAVKIDGESLSVMIENNWEMR